MHGEPALQSRIVPSSLYVGIRQSVKPASPCCGSGAVNSGRNIASESANEYVFETQWTDPARQAITLLVFVSHMSPFWLSVIVPSPLSTNRVLVQPLVSKAQLALQAS